VLAALAVPALVLGWLTRLANLPARVDEVGDGLFATLLLVVVAAMVRSLLTARRATVDTLLRATTVYLLLGTAFAMVYGIFSREDPGTFGAAAGVFSGPDGTMNLTDLLFFSFTTLTTLGYGDITPASPVVRMVACLQAVMGPLYLAVVVARLVALYSRERPQDDDAAGRGRSEGG
ncbi:MAG: potassium channel family protein, partial [Planctomycetota bacterium]|jgi:hypothetical protein